jgi:hypothetical protein
MSERIHVLAQQLFGKPTVAACSLQAIKEVAERYPYFAPAQFLLLEKLKQENDPAYAAQLQRAVLYYHNPLEFEYFISSDQFYTEIDLEEPVEITPVPEPVIGNEAEHQPEPETVTVEEPSHKPETSFITEPTSNEEIGAPVEEPAAPALPALTIAATDESIPLTFEPFHTVDYFASQGIKLSQEEVGQDKFGKQLKSFTAWLKTMKRLPQQAPPAESIDSSTEKNVQHLAADSVHEADVVTEAMAEVWLKQGNNSRAAEVYRKLSLLNPSKKAYFAAKIDQLKSS